MLRAVELSGIAYVLASDELRSDKEFAIECINKSRIGGRVFANFSDDF